MKHFFAKLTSSINIYIAPLFITAIAVAFVYPAVFTKGLWASFDSPFHITMIAQFYKALSYHDFPVVWTEGVANYGLPFGLIAHPLTSYVGGFISFITRNPLESYKIVWLLFSLISTAGMFRLLKKQTSTWPALAGATLYTFTAYRILNLYIRGALPEFAASAWLPFLLAALMDIQEHKSLAKTGKSITFWYIVILFTHPMYLLFASFLTGIFVLWYRLAFKYWIIIAASIALALCINAFYLLPLKYEMKYFYMGQSRNYLAEQSGLTLEQIYIERWDFTCPNGDTVELRCNRVQTGFIEIFLMGAGIFYIFYIPKAKKHTLLFLLILSGTTLILSLRAIEPLYKAIPTLGSIQFPYRFLNVWMLVPPFILALILSTYKKNQVRYSIIAICLILLVRLPQIYVKNSKEPDMNIFYFAANNIHSVMMNTIWMGESITYPVHNIKYAIIDGKGKIQNIKHDPTDFQYKIISKTPTTLAHYTFYFPGWHAYIDHKEVPIEWQDPNHRGYITVKMPTGEYELELLFKDTKIRLYSKIISSMGILVLIGFLCFQKHIIFVYEFVVKKYHLEWINKE